MNDHRHALARTTLLLNQEWFSGQADEDAIADALLQSTVRLIADENSQSCRAGQSALITAFVLISRLGIGIELDAPNLPLIDTVAPLRKRCLVDALIDIGGDLVPGAHVRTTAAEVDDTFAFGAEAADYPGAVRVTATNCRARLERTASSTPCEGDMPFGGLAAGAAAAAIALQAARPRIENAAGVSARTPRPSPGPPVRIDLAELFPQLAGRPQADIGRLDAISGGAITHALVYCLLRIPTLRARLRVIEKQDAELTNLNRYSLLRACDEHTDKVQLLERASTQRIQITGITALYTQHTRAAVLPLADRVLVGVDDIEARWWVQEAQPAWLAIGATSNHMAQLSTHLSWSPCAACLHPVAQVPATIPTISFVSFWAGLIQACALVSGYREPRNISIYPFALGGPSWLVSVPPLARRGCRLRCHASRRAYDGQAA